MSRGLRRHLIPITTMRAITSVNPAMVNNEAAISKNSRDALERSEVFWMPAATLRSNINTQATANIVGQRGFT